MGNDDGGVKHNEELPNWIYLLTCFLYLAACATAAILIEDLTLIFGIIAGIAECTTVFILPAIFYLKACRMEDQAVTPPVKRYAGGLFTRTCVVAYLILGVMYFVISNYFNITKMLR